jgi:FMN phosphatase YigB (HAD superfamily)
MVRAIIFDCFGVLAEDGWSPFKQQYLSDPAKAAKVSQLGTAADLNKATNDEMIHTTAHIAGVGEAVVRAALGRKVPNDELFKYIGLHLKPHYKIGMLSNASYDVTKLLFSREQMALFDATALSYELGLRKPSPRMYEVIAERLAVPIDHCLMVYDQAGHCAS